MLSVEVHGWDKVAHLLAQAPQEIRDEVQEAFGQSMAMVSTEAVRRTPIDTGYLRSSIGEETHPEGIAEMGELYAVVGTAVEYAEEVHEIQKNYTQGGTKYLERGLEAARPWIIQRMNEALQQALRNLT